jgi:uncharacterized membrane protein YdbT with pleckstrin-like domain
MAETLVWKGRTSHITNLGTYILCALFCWLIVPIFIAIWKWYEIEGEQYELTNKRFKEIKGVLNLRTDQLELWRVKDIALIEPLFLRLFKLASIELHTDDITTPLVLIEAIPAADARILETLIREKVNQARIDTGRVVIS